MSATNLTATRTLTAPLIGRSLGKCILASKTVYEGNPVAQNPGYRLWYGWKGDVDSSGHVASWTGEAKLYSTLRSAIRAARKYEKLGKHTKITFEKGNE